MIAVLSWCPETELKTVEGDVKTVAEVCFSPHLPPHSQDDASSARTRR